MLNTKDIYWLAGLLEGEGCFFTSYQSNKPKYKYPRILLGMTDRDVIEKAAKILGGTVYLVGEKKNRKRVWYVSVARTHQAVGWMMTLYSLMGERRKLKIKECLGSWKNDKKRPYKMRKENKPCYETP